MRQLILRLAFLMQDVGTWLDDLGWRLECHTECIIPVYFDE